MLLFLALGPLTPAQDANMCDEPGDYPDVIVGDLPDVTRWGTIGDISAYSVATDSCNVGTCWLKWISDTNEHPVIAQNLYRLKDGRFEQIGQSWLKHGFFARSDELCNSGCLSTDGTHLGVNCSDPYSAGLNGSQSRLGPRSEVNPYTGEFPYPFTTQGQDGDAIYKRLQVHNSDLDPTLNPGARYFVEGHYIAADDAAAFNADNNASYREVTVSGTGGVYQLNVTGETVRQAEAVNAWVVDDPQVKGGQIKVTGDGNFLLFSRATDLGGGQWHYEFALHNLNVNRAAGAFRVPIPAGAEIANIGFSDVDYHSGEPYDGTDWTGTVVTNTTPHQVVWSTESFEVNPNANALRWGTLYNFRFDANVAPIYAPVTVDLFLPGSPESQSGYAYIPTVCDGDGVCEPGETCTNCAVDCINQIPGVGFCGDGTCDPAAGEDCLSCGEDCAGQQNGPNPDRFCCGDGDGVNPVGCNDSRCTTGGFTCGPTTTETCCGDGTCDTAAESSCNCPLDCGPGAAFEMICDDGVDDDCDGAVDCQDADCCADAACATGTDADGDGVADCDCDDGNGDVWATPGEVTGVSIDPDDSGGTLIAWPEPAMPGAVTPTYDVLRSAVADDFVTATDCLAWPDPSSRSWIDPDSPAPGQMFHYLVRASNDCPDGSGPLGDGRDGRSCP